MFKNFESYVTPILLNCVDKYIKDFRAEDLQVSLWSGSVCLHNLELRPDIIQNEHNLPFVLTSGHIHELLIQVPWMKIIYEPIIITINTIECVLKLVENGQERFVDTKLKDRDKVDAPSGYVQSLVNRIVTNIAFRCHNIILKYVEEDMVVSVNIKQLYLDNVDGNWVPKFTDISPDDLHIRKLIRFSDTTLCLDKRNAAGKIEIYLEPLLYKCEIEIRVDSTYAELLNKRPKNTRICINSSKLEFNFSYQQVNMIQRIFTLILALKENQSIVNNFETFSELSGTSRASSLFLLDNAAVSPENNESWSGWMWSFVQPFPLGYSEEEQDISLSFVPILLFSFNFQKVIFSFKIPNQSPDSIGIYGNNQRKYRYLNLCSMELNNVSCESSSHGTKRFSFRGGIRSIVIYPENNCSCGIADLSSQNDDNIVYLKSVDSNHTEFKEWPVEYDEQSVVDSISVSEMLAICPAFSISSVYHLLVPDDHKSVPMSDLEYCNFKEDWVVDMVIGPLNIFVCSGMIHRFNLLKAVADTYDYPPYFPPKPLIKKSDLPPPTTDDYDALMEHISKINIKMSFVEPKVFISVWDHYASIKNPANFECGVNFPMLKRKISSNTDQNFQYEKLESIPSLMIAANFVQLTYCTPMYPHRLTYITCQLPNPPIIMLDACYSCLKLDVDDLQGFLVYKSGKYKKISVDTMDTSCIEENINSNNVNYVNVPIITQCNFQISFKYLLLDEYWESNHDIVHNDFNFNMENMMLCCTMAKALTVYNIVLGIFPPSEVLSNSVLTEKCNNIYSKNIFVLLNTTLVDDTFKNEGTVHLDINFEGLSLRYIDLTDVKTYRIVLNSVKVFAIDSLKEKIGNPHINQVWVISAPESLSSFSVPFMKTVLQMSTNNVYSTFFTLKLEEWSFVMDPLLCNWLTYTYQKYSSDIDTASSIGTENISSNIGNAQNVSQKRYFRKSVDETMHRPGGNSRSLNRVSAGHSSSDREKDYVHGTTQIPQNVDNLKEKSLKNNLFVENKTLHEESYYSNLIKTFFKWKNIAIFIEIENIHVYFPTIPISAVNFETVNGAIKNSIQNEKLNIEEILILKLPGVILRSSNLKQNLLSYCVHGLPAKLPQDIWDGGRLSYPWTATLKNLSCYTMSCANNDVRHIVYTNILTPVSSEIIISLSPKVGVENKASNQSKQLMKYPMNLKSTLSKEKANNKNNQAKSCIQKSIPIENKPSYNIKSIAVLKNVDPISTEQNLEDSLSSLAICIHIDTELIKFSFNQDQINLVKVIVHALKRLIYVLNCTKMSAEMIHEQKDISFHQESSYNLLSRNSSINEIVGENLQDESFSKDSDLTTEDCKAHDKNVEKKEIGAIRKEKENIIISMWLQWTISQICFKAYVSKTSDICQNKNYFKLVFVADDIVSSIDFQHDYVKLKSKVVTASIHHYIRTNVSDTWLPGSFYGIIMKGRENMKDMKLPLKNCFLSINITRAKCSSVHNKWIDMCKMTPKVQVKENDYISEIEISLQALDIILNLHSLQPFSFLFSSFLCSDNCDEVKNHKSKAESNSTTCSVAKSWDSRNLPLCYLEGSSSRIIFPVCDYENENDLDALVLQVDKVSLYSVADNPVCRSPLRLDIYQQAARKGFLVIPGSQLEDRQCQLMIKGIYLYTLERKHLERSFSLEIHLQPTINENPAFQWNNDSLKSSGTCPVMNIIEKVDICMVLALSMFHQTELICGPTFDLNIMSDVDLFLSLDQYHLIETLFHEFSILWKDNCNNIHNNEEETKSLSKCIYSEYFNKKVVQYIKDTSEYVANRNTPTLSTDTGISPDVLSNISNISRSFQHIFQKQLISSTNTDRTMAIDYYDFFITFGKINLSFFEKIENIDDTEADLEDENDQFLYTRPLFYGTLLQPNFSYSKHHYSTKSQFSIFHATLNLGDDCTCKGLPKIYNFTSALFETKLGIPDSISEIPPNFLTIKCEKNINRKYSVKFDVKSPVRLTFSLERLEHLNRVSNLLKTNQYIQNLQRNMENKEEKLPSSEVHGDQNIRNYFDIFDTFEITLTQVVLALNVQDDINYEMLISFQSFEQHMLFSIRPEKISNTGLLDSLNVTVKKTDDRQSKILIYPWTIGFEVNILWDSWQNIDSFMANPLYRVSIETDRLLMELGSDHMKIIQGIINFWNKNDENIKNILFQTNETNVVNENETKRLTFWNHVTPYDQYYKDDLRAGAFKFINENSGMPLPYQVFIGNKGITWKYPQPRTITCVHSIPVPFQFAAGDEAKKLSDELIFCTLEYFSETLNDFQYYSRFSIKQDQRVKMNYTKYNHFAVFASVWRVVMHNNEHEIFKSNISEKSSFDRQKFLAQEISKSSVNMPRKEKSCVYPIKLQALAACLRIDSFYTPHLIPKFQIMLNILSIETNFFNHYKQGLQPTYLDVYEKYQLNDFSPSSHVFCSVIFQKCLLQGNFWNKNVAVLKLNSDMRYDVVDGSDMILDKVIELKNGSLAYCMHNDWDGEAHAMVHFDNVFAYVGPQHIQTLRMSYETWKETLQSNNLMTSSEISNEPSIYNEHINIKPEMVITKYLICNDTNLPLRFGQIGTDENIVLQPRKCHLYYWKSTNSIFLLHMTINMGSWKHSKGFQIEKSSTTVLKLSSEDIFDSSASVIVHIDMITSVQRCVTFMGKLTFINTLPRDFNLKIYKKKVLELHGIMKQPIITVNANEKAPSLIIETNNDISMRLNFADAKLGWSGEIPVKECPKGNMPWLVKVPTQGPVQYISIWCRIVEDKIQGRTLVIFSPLYIVKSHIPISIPIEIYSEKFMEMSEYLLEGKGSAQVILCPGTTSTKHHFFINKLIEENFNEKHRISLCYDLVDNSSFFPKKEEITNIDQIVNNVKQWFQNKSCEKNEWPYMSSECGITWTAVSSNKYTDIMVRYLPTVRGIDSMIVDIAPWAIIGNCSGVSIFLCSNKNEEPAVINHGEVIIPSSYISKDKFYCQIYNRGSFYLSESIYINPAVLGPYEKKIQGCISLENYSTFVINCIESLCIFHMSYDVRNNINIFQVSSKYIFNNNLPYKITILPIIIPANPNIYTNIPSNCDDIVLDIEKFDISNVGIPLTEFHLLNQAIIDNEENALNLEKYSIFIYISLSTDLPFSCPVRIDKFVQRKSIVLKTIDDQSIPVIITCQEHKGKIFIAAHKDPAPQFFIQNKADLTISVAQVLLESVISDVYSFTSKEGILSQKIVPECEQSKWHCTINPNEETFYTVPTQNCQFQDLDMPNEIASTSENLYLTFSFIENDECDPKMWSLPVLVSPNNLEQFVKLPGYKGDIKVLVQNHTYATFITIKNVTQEDISASEIRQRLLNNMPTLEEEVEKLDKENEDLSDDVFQDIKCIVQDTEDSLKIINDKDCQYKKFLKKYKVSIIIERVDIVLTSTNFADEKVKTKDVISLICDKLIVTSSPSVKGITVIITMDDLQIDNPLHLNCTYDFHVLLVKQPSANKTLLVPSYELKPSNMSHMTYIDDVIEYQRKNKLFICMNEFEIWGSFYSGLEEVNVSIQPISLYLEDTYMSTLINYLTGFMSWNSNDESLLKHFTYGETSVVSVPEFIIWEGLAVSNPLRLKKLHINPLNVLLSVHSSILFYLALNNSPLQFGKFTRNNVSTSSYRLGHALTMHYLAEAVFGAGWVVSSLEILGSPGSLARKVSTGLRDLVREPCMGLMRGPWGFVVGMTHGSVSLLKHLTQGTVESFSMVLESVARNLDRLSLDEEHIRRTEQARRHRPQGLVSAVSQGLQGLGLSLLGAIGGIAHEVLIAGIEQRRGPAAMAAGLTRGIVGVITKPLSATADLLALTGQGFLNQAGWDQHPHPRWSPIEKECATLKNENFRLKLGNTFFESSLVYICQGHNKDTSLSVTLVLTNTWLILLDTLKDKVIEMDKLEKWRIIKHNTKTGELIFGVKSDQQSNSSSDNDISMDPALRARIAAYVGVVEDVHMAEHIHRIIFPTLYSSHCATMIQFARQHSLNQGFPII